MEEDLEDEFVPYKLRTELIELGYDVLKKSYGAVCYHREDMKGYPIISKETAVRIHGGSRDCINHPAILYRQAFRWFREKQGLFGSAYNDGKSIDLSHLNACNVLDNYIHYFKYMIYNIKTDKLTKSALGSFNTHEEAELACLKKLIEIVKEKK